MTILKLTTIILFLNIIQKIAYIILNVLSLAIASSD